MSYLSVFVVFLLSFENGKGYGPRCLIRILVFTQMLSRLKIETTRSAVTQLNDTFLYLPTRFSPCKADVYFVYLIICGTFKFDYIFNCSLIYYTLTFHHYCSDLSVR